MLFCIHFSNLTACTSLIDFHDMVQEYGSMDGSSGAIAQYDSQETQPPEFPLEGASTTFTQVRLVPGTDKW